MTVLFYLTYNYPLWSRFEAAYANFFQYFDSGKLSSTGIRLELWSVSLKIWMKGDMVLGAGAGSFSEQVSMLVAKGEVSSIVGRHGHAHNQLIHTLVERGLAGLFFLLLSFFMPLYLFLEKIKEPRNNFSSLAGIAIISTTFFSSMTQVLFAHNQSVVSYWMFICVFWYLSSLESEESTE